MRHVQEESVMAEEGEGRGTLAEGAARQLANATKTRAQWGGITPRWLIPLCRGPRSRPASIVSTRSRRRAARPRESLDVECNPPRDRDADLPETFVDYEEKPREYFLNAVTTVLDVHTRISDLYSSPSTRSRSSCACRSRRSRRTRKSELINNPDYGLLPTRRRRCASRRARARRRRTTSTS